MGAPSPVIVKVQTPEHGRVVIDASDGNRVGVDGVYVRDPAGELVFHELPTPTHTEVADVARRTAERIPSSIVSS